MMTAVELTNVSYRYYEGDGFSVLIVVTASIGNATDASVGKTDRSGFQPGTINLWVFINGKLQDEAFIQCIMTTTEAKAKALQAMEIKRSEEHTSELQSRFDLVCRLLLEKKNKNMKTQ